MSAHDVDELLRAAAGDARIISFAGGLPAASTFPREALAQAAREAIFHRDGEPLQYGWPEGREALRARIAARLATRGAIIDAQDVHITNGAQDALALALEVLGPVEVQVDAETYPGALDIFRARGCTPVLRAAAVRYAMPGISNPRGTRMDQAQRAACLDATTLIEDDAYGELDFESRQARPPLVAFVPQRVFHLGTLSKTVAPGLRIGWLVAPASFREQLREAKATRDLHASGLTQALAERLLSDAGSFERRLAGLVLFYRRRATALAELLAGIPGLSFAEPHGGFSVWVTLDRRGSSEDLLRRSLDLGVSFDPGSRFTVEPREQVALRLSYSSTSESRFAEGVRRLRLALGRP